VTALVACETLLLVLLVLLVAGLLRSHAEILRQLQELRGARGGQELRGAGGDALTTLPSPGRRAGGEDGHDVVGVTLARDAVKIGLGGDSPPTLLAFLSSGCDVCERFWDDLSKTISPRVGYLSIYSRRDGIVGWQSCLDPCAEHAEVSTTHCGMAVSPHVYGLVASKLAELRADERGPGRRTRRGRSKQLEAAA